MFIARDRASFAPIGGPTGGAFVTFESSDLKVVMARRDSITAQLRAADRDSALEATRSQAGVPRTVPRCRTFSCSEYSSKATRDAGPPGRKSY